VSVGVAYSAPPGTSISQQMLNDRIAYVLGVLGLSPDEVFVRATVVLAARRRRHLQQQYQPSLMTAPIDTSNCNVNSTTFLVEVSFLTANETIEQMFTELMQTAPVNPLKTAGGQNVTACSDPEVTSQRLVDYAPSPPNMPPMPYIAQKTIARTGGISVGVSAILLFGVAFFGQRCLAPTVRRRRKQPGADAQPTGESLNDSLMRWQ